MTCKNPCPLRGRGRTCTSPTLIKKQKTWGEKQESLRPPTQGTLPRPEGVPCPDLKGDLHQTPCSDPRRSTSGQIELRHPTGAIPRPVVASIGLDAAQHLLLPSLNAIFLFFWIFWPARDRRFLGVRAGPGGLETRQNFQAPRGRPDPRNRRFPAGQKL